MIGSGPDEPLPDGLRRSLGLTDAVVIGLGSMLGAGVFVALAPAARAAGSGLLIGLAVAAVVAYCNGTSSARLAALYPASGGTYLYGRARLGDFWGYIAGWGFVVGKTASCAAMALTVGAYSSPSHAHEVVVAAVVAMTTVNYFGVKKSAWLTRLVVAVVLAVLAAAVVSVVASGDVSCARLANPASVSVAGVLQAAGLLFFAFAGYENRHTGRRGARSVSHDSASHPPSLGHHFGGLLDGRRRHIGGLGSRAPCAVACAAERRRASKRCRVAGAGGQRWSRRRWTRIAIGVNSWRISDFACYGSRPTPSACSCGYPSSLPGAASE